MKNRTAYVLLAAVAIAVLAFPHAVSAAVKPDPRRPGGVDDTPSQTALPPRVGIGQPSTVSVNAATQTISFQANGTTANNVSVFGGYYTDPATGAVISGPYKYIRDDSGTPIAPAAQKNGCVPAMTVTNGVTVTIPYQVACPFDYGATIDVGDGENGATSTSGKDCTKRRRKHCGSESGRAASAAAASAARAVTASAESAAGTASFIDFSDCIFGCGDSGNFFPGFFGWWGNDSGGSDKLGGWMRTARPRPPADPNAFNRINKFYGGGGGDTFDCPNNDGCWIDGGGGRDTLHPNINGNDVVSGGSGDDTITQPFNPQLPDQFDIVDGGEGNDVIDNNSVGITYGGPGQDQIWASGTIFGNDGDDIITGGSLGDRVTMTGGAGNDTLHGDAGRAIDVAYYHDSTQPVTVQIGSGSGSGGTAGGDTLDDNIYGVVGTDYNDHLYGNGRDNSLDGGGGGDDVRGNGGKDVLHGGDGPDWITGGDGDDSLIGSDGNDVLDGGSGADRLSGSVGDDTLAGGPGADTFGCSGGKDIVTYAGGPGVTVSYGSRPKITNAGGAAGDKISTSCETIVGSDFNDILIGDKRPNTLNGGNGNDIIVARGNNHTHDTVDCGGGSDGVDVDNATFGSCETVTGTNGPLTLKSLGIMESGDRNHPESSQPNYQAVSSNGCCTGAYQFAAATWREEAARIGVNLFDYPFARNAPPAVQDAVAKNYIARLFQQYGSTDLGKIAVTWYYPACADGRKPMSTIPPKNIQTCQEYADDFLKIYNKLAPNDMPI